MKFKSGGRSLGVWPRWNNPPEVWVEFHGTYIKYKVPDDDTHGITGMIYVLYIPISEPSIVHDIIRKAYDSYGEIESTVLDMMQEHHNNIVSGMITGERE